MMFCLGQKELTGVPLFLISSASRLRHVQNILSSRKVGTPDIDGILCIAGRFY